MREYRLAACRPRARRFSGLAAGIIAGMLFLSGTDTQAAGVYRWTDEQGRVHYDDLNRGSGQRVTRDLLKQRRVPEHLDWNGPVPAEIVNEVQRRCDNAQTRLETYGAAPEIYSRNERGDVYRLTDSEARQMLAEIRGESGYYCGPDAARRVYADRLAEARRRQQEAKR